MASSLPCVRPPGPRDGRGQGQHQVHEDHGDGICKDDDVLCRQDKYQGEASLTNDVIKSMVSIASTVLW